MLPFFDNNIRFFFYVFMIVLVANLIRVQNNQMKFASGHISGNYIDWINWDGKIYPLWVPHFLAGSWGCVNGKRSCERLYIHRLCLLSVDAVWLVVSHSCGSRSCSCCLAFLPVELHLLKLRESPNKSSLPSRVVVRNFDREMTTVIKI